MLEDSFPRFHGADERFGMRGNDVSVIVPSSNVIQPSRNKLHLGEKGEKTLPVVGTRVRRTVPTICLPLLCRKLDFPVILLVPDLAYRRKAHPHQPSIGSAHLRTPSQPTD